MTLYRVYGKVVGTKYIGEFEAESKEEAEKMAMGSDKFSVSVCHYCSSECEDPEIESVIVESDEDEIEG
jgi:hypothetical protein